VTLSVIDNAHLPIVIPDSRLAHSHRRALVFGTPFTSPRGAAALSQLWLSQRSILGQHAVALAHCLPQQHLCASAATPGLRATEWCLPQRFLPAAVTARAMQSSTQCHMTGRVPLPAHPLPAAESLAAEVKQLGMPHSLSTVTGTACFTALLSSRPGVIIEGCAGTSQD